MEYEQDRCLQCLPDPLLCCMSLACSFLEPPNILYNVIMSTCKKLSSQGQIDTSPCWAETKICKLGNFEVTALYHLKEKLRKLIRKTKWKEREKNVFLWVVNRTFQCLTPDPTLDLAISLFLSFHDCCRFVSHPKIPVKS